MNIVELLKLKGLDVKHFKVKLFRHPAQVFGYKVNEEPFILDLDKLYRKSIKL